MLDKIKLFMDRFYGKKVLFFLPLIIIVLVVVAGLVVFVLSYLPKNNKVYSNSVAEYDSYSYGAEAEKSAYMPSLAGSVDSRGSSGNQSIPAVDRKVIKNASLSILVQKVEDSAKKIQAVAEKYKGSMDSSDISSTGADTKYGTMTIRVPNDQFNSAIEEIKGFAKKVNSENISSDDVTAQYVDLEARLKSKKAVEGQYITLLQRANKVDEIITVSTYLNNVREEIERLQAQLNYMSQQVSMSSITISMTSEAEVQVLGITWHPITVIKQSFRNLLTDLTGIVDKLIAFVFALPGILITIAIILGVLWAVVKIIKKIYRKFKGSGARVE